MTFDLINLLIFIDESFAIMSFLNTASFVFKIFIHGKIQWDGSESLQFLNLCKGMGRKLAAQSCPLIFSSLCDANVSVHTLCANILNSKLFKNILLFQRHKWQTLSILVDTHCLAWAVSLSVSQLRADILSFPVWLLILLMSVGCCVCSLHLCNNLSFILL